MAASRYRNVPDGELRPVPAVTGRFRHTVHAGDRLDHLATTYYGDPLAYWRICDADPEVLSPVDLLPGGPWRTTHLALTSTAGADVAALVRTFADVLGVRRATPVDGGVLVVHNAHTVEGADLVAVIAGAPGFELDHREDRDRVGAVVVIPPAGGP